MPETVRTIGLWIGRLKRSLRETREEIERQIGVDDIRRQLHNEDIMRSLENARVDINQAIHESQQALDPDALLRNQHHTYEHSELPDHAHEQAAPAEALAISTTENTIAAEHLTESEHKKTPLWTLPKTTKNSP